MNFRLPPLPSTETLGWGIVGASTVAAERFLPSLRSLPAIGSDDKLRNGARQEVAIENQPGANGQGLPGDDSRAARLNLD